MFEIDILYKILISSNIQAMKNMYAINKITHNLLRNMYEEKYFWVDKFAHDTLPILISKIPATIYEWFEEYERCYNSKQSAKIIQNVIKYGYIYSRIMKKGSSKDHEVLSFEETSHRCNRTGGTIKLYFFDLDIIDVLESFDLFRIKRPNIRFRHFNLYLQLMIINT